MLEQYSTKIDSLGGWRATEKGKNMLEDENDKHVRTITGGTFKSKEMPRDENLKTVTFLR